MTLLCGRTARQCEEYIRKHHFDRSKTRIITDKDQLYGYIHGTLLIMIGDYYENGTANAVKHTGLQMGLAVVVEVQ